MATLLEKYNPTTEAKGEQYFLLSMSTFAIKDHAQSKMTAIFVIFMKEILLLNFMLFQYFY